MRSRFHLIGTIDHPHALSQWGGAFFKKGQLQCHWKQVNLEQDPGSKNQRRI